MPQVLFINSSPVVGDGHRGITRRMARVLRDSVRGGGIRVVERDLAANPPRLIDKAWKDAAVKPLSALSQEDKAILSESDKLVNEVLHADVIVVSCPVYAFGVPSPLKAWLGNLVRPGKTLSLCDDSPVAAKSYGLLHAKRVIVLTANGAPGKGPSSKEEVTAKADAAIKRSFQSLGVRNIRTFYFEEGTNSSSLANLEVANHEMETLGQQLRSMLLSS